MSRIEVRKIDTGETVTRAEKLRNIIERFEDQQFNTKHLVAVYLSENYDTEVSRDEYRKIKRSARQVLSQGLSKGTLIAVYRSKSGDHSPGIFKRKRS